MVDRAPVLKRRMDRTTEVFAVSRRNALQPLRRGDR